MEHISRFQGSSEEAVHELASEATQGEIDRLIGERRRVSRRNFLDSIQRIFSRKDEDSHNEDEDLEKARDDLIRLIERYADLALRLTMQERFMKMQEEIQDVDKRRHELHNQIRELASKIGISDDKAMELIEMRVQDRLAEPEVRKISDRASEITGENIHCLDDDLSYSYSLEGGERKWNLPRPEERKGTYSLSFGFVFRPSDGALFIGMRTLDKEVAKRVENLFKKIADSGMPDVETRSTSHHYCHDSEFPDEDYMAYRVINFYLTFPKKSTNEVLRALEEVIKS